LFGQDLCQDETRAHCEAPEPLVITAAGVFAETEETRLADVICQSSLAACLEAPESWQISSGHVRSDCYCLRL